MPVETTAAGAAVLEIERFEWVKPERIEIAGVWSGLRGRRFMRPTLVLKGEGEPKRLLALLEHKPWTADDGAEWIAAFSWDGPVVKFESAELNVGSGIDLKLPSPRMRPGKPRRFRHRAVSHDGSREPGRDAATHASGPGIVTEPPAVAEAPDAPPVTDAPVMDAPVTERAEAPAPDPAEALRKELDAARSARDRLRAERDSALDQVRALRGQVEDERHAKEVAVAAARAEERSAATTMLSQGAELRAAVERQRELAYHARDEAEAARDAAIAARDKAIAEKDDAVRERKQAERLRDKALADRDRAYKEHDRAISARDDALRERDRAYAERDEAVEERDTIVSLHERGLPVIEPKPRFLPERGSAGSQAEIWAPRAVALGLLFLFAVIVLRLFSGA